MDIFCWRCLVTWTWFVWILELSRKRNKCFLFVWMWRANDKLKIKNSRYGLRHVKQATIWQFCNIIKTIESARPALRDRRFLTFALRICYDAQHHKRWVASIVFVWFGFGSLRIRMRTCGIWSIIIKLTVHNHRLRRWTVVYFRPESGLTGWILFWDFLRDGGRYRFRIWIAVIRHTFVSGSDAAWDPFLTSVTRKRERPNVRDEYAMTCGTVMFFKFLFRCLFNVSFSLCRIWIT